MRRLIRGVEIGVISRPASQDFLIIDKTATTVASRHGAHLYFHSNVEESLNQADSIKVKEIQVQRGHTGRWGLLT